MRILPIECKNNYRNLNYLLIDESSGQALCIDPYDAGQVSGFLVSEKVKLKAIINTHEHWDHTKGNKDLKAMTGCEIWAGEGISPIDRLLTDGQKIEFGDYTIEVHLTPGHTMNHISLLIKEEGANVALFPGDTLFNAGVGNCHNGGHPETLFQSFETFFSTIEDKVMVFPGHDYVGNNLAFAKTREPSNPFHDKILKKVANAQAMGEVCFLDMGEERQINPFLRLDQKEIQDLLPSPTTDRKSIFLQLRQLRNDW